MHKRALDQTEKFISEIGDDQWEKESINPGWSIRDLVNHIVSENFWVPDMVEGKHIEEVGDKYDGDMLGENPLKAYKRSAKAADEAFSIPGALSRLCHLSYGDIPVKDYLKHRFNDVLIHGWDVAKSTGQNDNLPLDLVDALYKLDLVEEDSFRSSGMFGSKVEVEDNADTQTKLLAILGRIR